MKITEAILRNIKSQIRLPDGYHVELCSIVEHGPMGLVVAYKSNDKGRVDYRCAGFRWVDQRLVQTFDMIVEGGVT